MGKFERDIASAIDERIIRELRRAQLAQQQPDPDESKTTRVPVVGRRA